MQEAGHIMAEKQLESTVAAAEDQKAWFAALRRDVFEKQKPYAIVQADMPLELFQVDGCAVGQQSMVGRNHIREAALAGLSGLPE